MLRYPLYRELTRRKNRCKIAADSVDFVLVLILSDCTDMDGGELQVLQLADASGKFFDEMKVHGIPKDKVESVAYPGAGFCVLMQGTKILHSVTPVLAARETRLSFVNAYGRRCVWVTPGGYSRVWIQV
jgi:hypothetical protein